MSKIHTSEIRFMLKSELLAVHILNVQDLTNLNNLIKTKDRDLKSEQKSGFQITNVFL